MKKNMTFYIRKCKVLKIKIQDYIIEIQKLEKIYNVWKNNPKAKKYYEQLLSKIKKKKLLEEKKLIEYQKKICILKDKNGN